MKEVILEDGKYRFFDKDNILYCHRYGEPWRNFLGDHAVTLLFNKVLELSEKKKEED